MHNPFYPREKPTTFMMTENRLAAVREISRRYGSSYIPGFQNLLDTLNYWEVKELQENDDILERVFDIYNMSTKELFEALDEEGGTEVHFSSYMAGVSADYSHVPYIHFQSCREELPDWITKNNFNRDFLATSVDEFEKYARATLMRRVRFCLWLEIIDKRRETRRQQEAHEAAMASMMFSGM